MSADTFRAMATIFMVWVIVFASIVACAII